METIKPGEKTITEADESSRASRSGVTPRVAILIAILLPLNAYWIIHMTTVRYVGFVTIASLFYNTIMLLTLLAAVNGLLKRWLPRFRLRPAELAAIYSLLAVATSPCGLDTSSILLPAIAGPFRLATPENQWHEIFIQYLPELGTMRDEASLQAMWAGSTNFFSPPHLQLWAKPLLFWFLYMSALWTAPLGLAALFRRRWMEVERLTYPIIQLPTEMCRADGRMWRQKPMWIALGVVAGINILNGLHALYPMVPQIPVRWDAAPGFDISRMLVDRPWSAAHSVRMSFYPFIIGLGLLLPTDLAFSCWFFFVLFRVQMVIVDWLGLNVTPQFPYLYEQAYGAYIGLALFYVWMSRRELGRIWQGIRGRKVATEESLPYRLAAGLLVGCIGFVLAALIHHGMSPWVALLFVTAYYMATYLIGRIRAEVGIPVHEFDFMSPLLMMGNVLGPKVVGKRSLAVMAMHTGYSRGLRNIPFPHQCEAFKMAEGTGGSLRRLAIAMGIVVIAGFAFSLPATLQIFYANGVGAKMQGYPRHGCAEPYNYIVSWFENPKGFNAGRAEAIVIGVISCLALLAIRVRTVGFPLHPVGMAVGISWYMSFMWFPFLIAWVAKVIVARYGGSQGLRTLAFVAFGLILGDVLTGGFWLIYGFARDVPTYAFWH